MRRPTSSRRGLLSESRNSSIRGTSKKNRVRVIITPWKTIEIKWQITSRSILDYQQIYPVKLTSNEPYRGGPWGGALRSSLPMGGLWGPWVTGSTAYSIPGVHQGIAPHPWVGPRPMAPLLGEGGIHSREALLGSISVYISLVSLEYVPPPDGPQYRGSRRNLPRKLGELDSRY